jgi:hypothetical protein
MDITKENKIIEAIREDRYHRSVVKIEYIGKSIFEWHCGMRTAKFKMFERRDCEIHPVFVGKIFVCQCPDCKYIASVTTGEIY